MGGQSAAIRLERFFPFFYCREYAERIRRYAEAGGPDGNHEFQLLFVGLCADGEALPVDASIGRDTLDGETLSRCPSTAATSS